MAEEQTTGTEYMTVQDFTNALQNIKSYIESYVAEPEVVQEIVNGVIEILQPKVANAFRYAGSADSSTTASASGAFPAPTTTAYGNAYVDVALGSDNTTPINQVGICLPLKEASPSMTPAWHRILMAPLTSGGKGVYSLNPFPGSSSQDSVDVTTKSIVDRLNDITDTMSALSAAVSKVYASFCSSANPWFTTDAGGQGGYYGQIRMASGSPQMWVPSGNDGRWADIECKCTGDTGRTDFWRHCDSSAAAKNWATGADGRVGTYLANDGETLMAVTSGASAGVAISHQWMTGGTSTTCNATSIKILGSNNSDAGVTITAQVASPS